MVARQVSRCTTASPLDPTAPAFDFVAVADQWVGTKDMAKVVAERTERLRSSLMGYLEIHGEDDATGSQVLPLPEGTTVGGREASVLRRERRVSTALDEEAIVALLTRKGLLERVMVAVPTIDHDEVYLLHQEGLLSEAEIDSLITRRITWALVAGK